jgi:capsular polysaccharide biosynthesis protein
MNEQKKAGEGTEIDLKRLFDAIWHRAWVILVVSILCGALVFMGTFYLITPK